MRASGRASANQPLTLRTTDRTRLRRKSDRACGDSEVVAAILDEALVSCRLRRGEAELRATLVVRLPIDEGSAKVRTGGPVDEPADLALGHWAGVIPVAMTRGQPEPSAAAATDPSS